MAEPPAKRAKRTDSSVIWDRTEIEIGETIQTAVTDVTIATELADTTIADEEVPDHDRETGEGTGAGRENMTEMGRGRKMVGAVEGKGEIVRSAAGVEAGVGVETAIESRRFPKRSALLALKRKWKLTDSGFKDEKSVPLRSERQRTRSRSPAQNGTTKNLRTRSPPRKPIPETTKPPITKPADPQPNPTPIVDKMQVDSPAAESVAPVKAKSKSKAKAKAAPEEDSDPEVAQMRALMGFAGFKTTKDTKVPGNNVYAVRKEKKTEYRQYMNRVGGFNRPLSPSR
ncbi:hypothetical protein MMC34_006569 [Xylographa carneopallida]|nr:hypothetical protein [Xylographa carneopallida]